jgi:hypothetical protein
MQKVTWSITQKLHPEELQGISTVSYLPEPRAAIYLTCVDRMEKGQKEVIHHPSRPSLPNLGLLLLLQSHEAVCRRKLGVVGVVEVAGKHRRLAAP